MDFIMPEYSLENVKSTMENGNFFVVGRRARKELPDDFVGEGPLPRVTGITVDEESDTISIKAVNAEKVQWIANGTVIDESLNTESNEIVSTIKLREHSGDITCYVRFQLTGPGGICFSQPFTCDNGSMSSYIINDDRTNSQKFFDKLIHILSSIRLYVAFQEIYRKIF